MKMNAGIWIGIIGGIFGDYNLHTGYKVVINRPNAYYSFEQDRRRYGGRKNDRYNRYNNGRHRGNNRW